MNSKVSIVVPIYNVQQYLEKCVESLINQSYENIEIFLVDDGSTDASGSLCDKLSEKDKRIKVTHKENGGYGSVLEYSIKNISSSYFLICDPDDWLEKNAVEILIRTMQSYNTDLVVGRKNVVYLDGTIKSDSNDFKILHSNVLYHDFINFLTIPCSPHSKLYKKNLCVDIKFPNKINNTDYLLYQVYLTKIKSAVYLDQALSNYFIDRPGNTFNADVALTEKSLKSNSIVSASTLAQLDKKSHLFKYSLVNLFVRACSYLALMKKYNIRNSEYYDMNINIMDKYQISKRDLFRYLDANNSNVIKCAIKKILYLEAANKTTRKYAINILSKIK
ncbi:MAG: glycosyltransferase family 2 protein [Lachnospiraceae bacterium]|jgi:glycosyltransferase involved in cell wall biosynthesis